MNILGSPIHSITPLLLFLVDGFIGNGVVGLDGTRRVTVCISAGSGSKNYWEK